MSDVDRSAVGRKSRNKGSRAELKIAKQIAEAIGVPYQECRRTPNSGALIERADLRLSPRAQERFPWFVEVKHREDWNIWQAFANPTTWKPHTFFQEAVTKEKAERHSGFHYEQLEIMLVLLQNRKPTLVMLAATDARSQTLDSHEVVIRVGTSYIVRDLASFLKMHTATLALREKARQW